MSNLYVVLVFSVAILHSMVAMYLLSLPFVLFRKHIPAWYIKVHMVIFSIAAGFHFTSGVCPLTFGENYLRGLANLPTYQGNFLNQTGICLRSMRKGNESKYMATIKCNIAILIAKKW